MPKYINSELSANSIPITPLLKNDFDSWQQQQPEFILNQISRLNFNKSVGNHLVLLSSKGSTLEVIVIVSDSNNPHEYAKLPTELPVASYHIASENTAMVSAALVGWGLGSYQFDRYKNQKELAELSVSELKEKYQYALESINSTNLVRDLINTPADDMGPTELSDVMEKLAEDNDAKFSSIVGEELLEQNFPAIHLIGRASFKEPRLLSLQWGKANDPLVSLVGKGVCFDTGGNNVKPATGMRNMKKDMGGAAHVLGLAQMIMKLNLPIQLQVLVPAVENAIAGNAHRQGDIVKTRSGLTVEIGHTDAEGRMILSDALTYANEQNPELIVDFATLTGAARVALGADLPPVFSNELDCNTEIMSCSNEVFDPLWPMPLYQGYLSQIQPSIADLRNTGSVPLAGCITAALFLQQFIKKDTPWVHIDTFGWSNGRTGHPKGGDALGMLAMYNWIAKRFGANNE